MRACAREKERECDKLACEWKICRQIWTGSREMTSHVGQDVDDDEDDGDDDEDDDDDVR